MAKITMKELAALTSTSLATISRTFRSPHLVHPETRERILAVAKKHQYVYDALAGDLSRRSSTVIGILIPMSNRSRFGDSVLAIQNSSLEKNFSIITCNTEYDSESERKLLRQFQERRVAGLITTGFTIENEICIKELIQSGTPCVCLWEKLYDNTISYVGFDNFKAAYSATEYLISLRHRRIGLLIGSINKIRRIRKRFDGYKAALETHGIPYDPALVIERSLDFLEGKHSIVHLLSLTDRPTAIFAASDTHAIGALTGIKEMGSRVPHDVSLVGFGDIDFAAYCDPPLTTVRVPAFEMGKLAAKVLLEMIENKTTEVRQYCLETNLIIRKSCREVRPD